jgi:ribose 1,5-bisphosphokinase
MSGCFVCVVGPSGAGKDTLIGLARRELAGDAAFVFPRRLVTRPANAFEDHETISDQAFEAGLRERGFALAWRAHGLGYALDRAVGAAVADGAVVVCNISRASIGEARKRFAQVRVVLVTAPPSMLAERLTARGREAGADVQSRLARTGLEGAGEPDLVIVNDGAPENGGARLAAFLRRLREPARVAEISGAR